VRVAPPSTPETSEETWEEETLEEDWTVRPQYWPQSLPVAGARNKPRLALVIWRSGSLLQQRAEARLQQRSLQQRSVTSMQAWRRRSI
jgi:hypothetical protein